LPLCEIVATHGKQNNNTQTLQMKKTLLIAAAALAAGIISTQASSVYSQNIVGYINTTVPANGFALVGNQLNLDGTNGISQVFGSGLVSDVNAVNNTAIYLWLPGVQQYQSLQYFNATDAAADWGGPAGFYDGGGTYYNNPLPPGQAAFLLNVNNSTPLTNTFTGTVPQGTNIMTTVPGFNLYSLSSPVVTNLCDPNGGNYTGVSDVNAVNNDQVYLWVPSVQQYQALQYFDTTDAAADWGGPAGFYDGGGTFYNVAPKVGEGFFIDRLVNVTTTWTNKFSF